MRYFLATVLALGLLVVTALVAFASMPVCDGGCPPFS